MTATTRADHDVLEAARRGDPRAWEHIYYELGGTLTRFAASRGVPDAEDVTQEVMYAAARRIDRFSGDWDGLRSWLFAIAYRRCADHHRRRYRHPEQPTDRLPEDAAPDSGADAEVWAEAERWEALASLDILDAREREVVTRRVLDELGTGEVADALGISRGNVRVIQSRALAKLRRHLENNGGCLDRRFRNLAALLGLEKTYLGARFLKRVGARLTGGRPGRWMGTLPNPALPLPPGSPRVLATTLVAVGITAGAWSAVAPPADRPTDVGEHGPTTLVHRPAESVDEQEEGDRIGASHGDRLEGAAAGSGPGPASPGILTTLDPETEDQARLTSAVSRVEEEGVAAGSQIVGGVTGAADPEDAAADLERLSESVTDAGPSHSSDLGDELPTAPEQVLDVADESVVPRGEAEPEDLLDR